MDGFEVYCPNDGKKSRPTVFMEMYHEHVEEQPIEGFTIRPKLWEKYMEAAVDAVKQENYPEAQKHVKAAVLEIEKHGADNDIQSATTFFAYGYISLHIKNFDMAKVAFRKAIKFEKSSRGENHPRVAISLIMLAHAHLELKEIKKVEPLIQETIKIYKITSYTDNRQLILRQLMPYIMLLDEKGHIDIAKRLISKLKDLIE
jgi:tetratricopeptide (TPR) repeat protein